MDVYEAIRRRVAVREFKPDPVPHEVVERLLLAVRWAPSTRNKQPWRVVVVQDKPTITKIGALSPSGGFIAKAPVALAITMEAGVRNEQLDAGRIVENLELMAWSLGLGTCYVGQMDRDAVKALLGIPAESDLVTVMPFGYPTDAAKKAGKKRKPLSEIAYRDHWGQPLR